MPLTLGQRLKALRRDTNLTLRELGKKVGVDFTYLSKIENDKTDNRPPSADLLSRLAQVLNADEGELMLLARRIPEEAKKIFTTDKNALQFFRTIKNSNRDQKFWDEINELVEKHTKRNG